MFRVELLIYWRVIIINYRTSHFLFRKGHQKSQKVFVGYDLIAVVGLDQLLPEFFFGKGHIWTCCIQCEAPKIAKLVYNSDNYGLWYL